MAKKARMANINTMRGINIFKDGIPGTSEPDDELQNSEQADPEIHADDTPTSSANQQMSEPLTRGQSEPMVSQTPMPTADAQKDEKKTLRSYHLSEAVINRLEDAYMVYSLKKIDKSKQDIVAEALEKHFAELEQQGFFQVLELLRR